MNGISQSFIELVSPNGGDVFKINSEHSITWNSMGIQNVKIEYTSGFNNQFPGPNIWTVIVTSIPASSVSYKWILPSTILSAARIRISDASDSTMYDISDLDFSSYDPVTNPKKLHIISPNGGEVLDTASSYFNISWTYQNVYLDILFQYTIDNGQHWIQIDSLLYGNTSQGTFYSMYRSYNWSIPNVASNQCKIRILDKTDNTIFDESDNVFTISNASSKKIGLLAPNGGENFKINTAHAITWNSFGTGNIKIEYTVGFNTQFPGPSNWIVITPSTPASSGSYTWTLPSTILSQARIRISDVSDPSIYDISDLDFSSYDPISTPKYLRIISPNGGEVLDTASSSFNISWTYQNVYFDVLFQYTVDNGQHWIPIDTLLNGNITQQTFFSIYRSYNWPIPNISSNQCKIRILDKTDNTIFDEGDNVFTISNAPAKKIALLTPNGGEIFKTNSACTIRWISVGIANVKIEYTTGFNTQYPGPNSWTVIAPSVPASSGSYTWTLPSAILSSARIRISEASDPIMYDISDLDFSSYDPVVTPKNLHLLSPNNGEHLIGKSTYSNITWTYQNEFGVVLFEYSIDNGQNWIPIDTLFYGNYAVSTFYSTYRSYNWHIPAVISNQCKVRILDLYDNSIMDESDLHFSIVSAPIVNFMADQTNITIGNIINFADLSGNAPIQWKWSFPGGTPDNSSQQNPSIKYENKGTFTVSLIATNEYGADTLVKSGYITVGNAGLIDNSNLKELKIFPNPNRGVFTIELTSIVKQDVELELLNAIGNIVLRMKIPLQSGKIQQRIQITSAPSGLYQLLLRTDQGVVLRRLIKE
jgi:PKD repeat protein